jgi:hypothetical protein
MFDDFRVDRTAFENMTVEIEDVGIAAHVPPGDVGGVGTVVDSPDFLVTLGELLRIHSLVEMEILRESAEYFLGVEQRQGSIKDCPDHVILMDELARYCPDLVHLLSLFDDLVFQGDFQVTGCSVGVDRLEFADYVFPGTSLTIHVDGTIHVVGVFLSSPLRRVWNEAVKLVAHVLAKSPLILGTILLLSGNGEALLHREHVSWGVVPLVDMWVDERGFLELVCIPPAGVGFTVFLGPRMWFCNEVLNWTRCGGENFGGLLFY